MYLADRSKLLRRTISGRSKLLRRTIVHPVDLPVDPAVYLHVSMEGDTEEGGAEEVDRLLVRGTSF